MFERALWILPALVPKDGVDVLFCEEELEDLQSAWGSGSCVGEVLILVCVCVERRRDFRSGIFVGFISGRLRGIGRISPMGNDLVYRGITLRLG
jgi:hypothetical protein